MNNRNIYIIAEHDFDDFSIIAIFSDKELAIEICQRHNAKRKNRLYLIADVFEISFNKYPIDFSKMITDFRSEIKARESRDFVDRKQYIIPWWENENYLKIINDKEENDEY